MRIQCCISKLFKCFLSVILILSIIFPSVARWINVSSNKVNMSTLMNRLKEASPCLKQLRPDYRTIQVGHTGHQQSAAVDALNVEKFPSNRVVSSKYTKWNFLPKNLFEQLFYRIANFYFLVLSIIMLCIDSPVSPWTTIAPLILVIFVTAVKQGYEDWLRHKADKEINHLPSQVLRSGQIQSIKSKDIQVGDIVRVAIGDGIPCDMVMLSSEDEEGECYITTANLDGEANLKTYRCASETRHMRTAESLRKLTATIECEQPITDLYKFKGRLIVLGDSESSNITSLGAENVLLRGSRLKNTHFVFGCCVYSGQETKISLNSIFKSTKFSTIERKTNKFLIIFLVLLILYSGTWVGFKHWFYSYEAHRNENMWYLQPPEKSATFLVVLEEFFAFMVLMSYVIPISMYVTIEFQKFLGSLFFVWDIEMYDAVTNEPAKANTSDINEELGQVEYLFTDKTGTLTENDLKFRQCSINGIKYEDIEGKLCYKTDITGEQPRPVIFQEELEEFFMVLALCHTARVDRNDGLDRGTYSESGKEYEYQASSPDEKALVEACRKYGFVYHGIRDGKMAVSISGDTTKLRYFTQHHILDFDSTRKRMSVIVEDEKDNFYLMCKGAETSMLDRISNGDIQTIEQHITDYAKLGLRTLCIAWKKLSKDEYEQLNKVLNEAKTDMNDRDTKLAEAFEQVEKGMTLLGATAVEDRLQDGVPETLFALRRAGIQVWVLTGDKEEAAVNISYSAGHFYADLNLMSLTRKADSDQSLETLNQFHKTLHEYEIRGDSKQHGLVVDGQSLAFALRHHGDLFRQVCRKVVTVLCCRMSPIQKAEVVKLIKSSNDNPTVAAIGDGANDVSMIQEAHVGLGIIGKEGRQAARCSDYAFGRFRFLQRALLVHGHYFYIRLAVLIQYFFYKNVAMITAQLYFTFFSAFSYQSFYVNTFLTYYNITFTALPILIYGLFELNIPQAKLLEKPGLYRINAKNARLSNGQFLLWNLIGLWHSLVFYFGVYFSLEPGNATELDGQMYGIYEYGAIVMTTCVITVNVKMMLESYYWNGVTFFSFSLTFAGYFALVFLYSAIYLNVIINDASFYGIMEKILGSGYVWLTILSLVILALLPDILIRGIRDNFGNPHKKTTPKNHLSDSNSTLISQDSGHDNISPISTISNGNLVATHSKFDNESSQEATYYKSHPNHNLLREPFHAYENVTFSSQSEKVTIV